MVIKAVLTGDLIQSRKTDNPVAFIDAMKAVLRQLEKPYKVKAETFRGDGFQIVPKRASQGLRCAVALRVDLIASSPQGER
ncbi:hypothetical protein [Paraburkholderia phosphatilytica]|uniref:hypothetical protein n=1 Tax=Paraburkholderia phosphatilytica TaxID=2282883 RepID=UPI0019807605|nr:hypothetical protein [Paraburkholderia phosphatilytica]